MNSSRSEMNNFDHNTPDLITWRRSKVLEYISKGYNQSEIAGILKVSQPTITRDVRYIKEHARENIRSFLEERLPEEVDKAFTSFDSIIKTAWNTAEKTNNDKTKLQALDLVNKTMAARIDLATNVDAIDYVMNMATEKKSENEVGCTRDIAKQSESSESEEYEDLQDNEE